MKKDNIIISFDSYKRKRKKTKYELKAEISIYLHRFNGRCALNWYTNDKKLSEDNIYYIQKSILSDLVKKVPQIEYNSKECYEINFTLLYYEKSKNEFKYICTSPNITNEKLVEYLLISTSIYEFKKSKVR